VLLFLFADASCLIAYSGDPEIFNKVFGGEVTIDGGSLSYPQPIGELGERCVKYWLVIFGPLCGL